MGNAWKHFRTITKHRHMVIKNCYRAGILFQGLFHDLSKYAPVEFMAGAKYYKGYKSPNDCEREEHGYSEAWMHHKGRNKHHFEYWTDYCPKTHKIVPVKMPYKYVAEMFCDRLAASKVYQKEKYTPDYPLEYFLKGKQTRMIHKETSDEIENLLYMLKKHDEDYVFRHIRKKLKSI